MQKAICPHCYKEIDIDSGQLSSGDPNCPLCAQRRDGYDLLVKDEDGLSYVPKRLSSGALPKETDPDPPIIHQLSALMLPYQPKVKWHSLDDQHNKGILEFGGLNVRNGKALTFSVVLLMLTIFPFFFIAMNEDDFDINSWGWIMAIFVGLAIWVLFRTANVKDYIIVTKNTLEFRHGHNPKSAKLLIEIPRIKIIPVKLEVQKTSFYNSAYDDYEETRYSIFVTNPDTLRTVEVVNKYKHPGTLVDDDAGKELKKMIRTLLFADLR